MSSLWLLTLASAAAAVQLANVGFDSRSRGATEWNPFAHLHPSSHQSAAHQLHTTRVQRLENDADVAYYGEIWLGGQKLKAIFDSGSFELLAFGTKCSLCGKRLYNHSQSKTSQVMKFKNEHAYGSGSCESIEVLDKLEIAGFTVPRQQFWEVVDTDIFVLEAGAFQAILGLGPPESAKKFAEQEQEEAREEMKQLAEDGEEITDWEKEAMQQWDDVVDLMKKTKGVIQQLAIDTVSFCFGRESQSAGHVVWNDQAPRHDPHKFITLDVVGDFYWSAGMSSVKLSGDESSGTALDLGCADGNCSAILDTGTSLLTAPKKTVQAIHNMAEEWEAAGGTCDDLSKLPELKFQLNGHDFVLPPESYMGVVEGAVHQGLKQYMPELYERQEKSRMEFSQREGRPQGNMELKLRSCAPLVMSMDADSQFGQLWILGVPFFRTYYTSFQFEQTATGPPTPATMAFSVANGNCTPSTIPSSRLHNEQLRSPDPHVGPRPSTNTTEASLRRPRPATMHVDANKIRVPSWVQGIRRHAKDMWKSRAGAAISKSKRHKETAPQQEFQRERPAMSL